MYAETSLLRALIAAIPYAGGSLDMLLAAKGQTIVRDRVTALLDDLREELHGVRDSQIAHAFLESEACFDLLTRSMEATARTRDREKIRAYAKILRGAMTTDKKPPNPEVYVAILAGLNDDEVRVARVIYEQQGDDHPMPADGTRPKETDLQFAQRKGWDALPEGCTWMEKDDLPAILVRLQSSGLIKEVVGIFIGYEGGVYTVTNAFRRLMDYLNDTGERPRDGNPTDEGIAQENR